MGQIEELILRLVDDVRTQTFFEHNAHCNKNLRHLYARRIEETKVRLSEDHGINIP